MTTKILCLNTTMQYLKDAVIILSPFRHHFTIIFPFHHFPMMNSKKDHEKLCVHIRNMHRYLHRVRKEIDNELAKTYRKKCTLDLEISGLHPVELPMINFSQQIFIASKILLNDATVKRRNSATLDSIQE